GPALSLHEEPRCLLLSLRAPSDGLAALAREAIREHRLLPAERNDLLLQLAHDRGELQPGWDPSPCWGSVPEDLHPEARADPAVVRSDADLGHALLLLDRPKAGPAPGRDKRRLRGWSCEVEPRGGRHLQQVLHGELLQGLERPVGSPGPPLLRGG